MHGITTERVTSTTEDDPLTLDIIEWYETFKKILLTALVTSSSNFIGDNDH